MATKKDQKDQTNHEEKTDQHEPSVEKEGQEDSSLNDTEDADEGASEASPEERIALLEAELAQQKDKYLRMFADFDNAGVVMRVKSKNGFLRQEKMSFLTSYQWLMTLSGQCRWKQVRPMPMKNWSRKVCNLSIKS